VILYFLKYPEKADDEVGAVRKESDGDQGSQGALAIAYLVRCANIIVQWVRLWRKITEPMRRRDGGALQW